MRHAELLGERLAPGIDVDADDLVGAHQLRALDDVQADAAEAEYDDVRTRLDPGGVDDRAHAGGHAAADVAHLVEGRVLADLRHGDFGQHGEVRERRAAHVVMNLLFADGEPARPVGHDSLALRRADSRAQIGLLRRAGFALAALGRIERNHVIALLDGGDAGSEIHHDPRALVPENHREQSLGIGARAGELVGVADTRRLQLYQHLAGLRTFEVHRGDLKRLACRVTNCSFGFHSV